jgi:hypothetical protein
VGCCVWVVQGMKCIWKFGVGGRVDGVRVVAFL